eukprot:29351-Pelagococcus_subviridis.AAC.4
MREKARMNPSASWYDSGRYCAYSSCPAVSQSCRSPSRGVGTDSERQSENERANERNAVHGRGRSARGGGLGRPATPPPPQNASRALK